MWNVFVQSTGRTVLCVPWKWLARLVAGLNRRWDYARQGEGW